MSHENILQNNNNLLHDIDDLIRKCLLCCFLCLFCFFATWRFPDNCWYYPEIQVQQQKPRLHNNNKYAAYCFFFTLSPLLTILCTTIEGGFDLAVEGIEFLLEPQSILLIMYWCTQCDSGCVRSMSFWEGGGIALRSQWHGAENVWRYH